MKYNYKVVVCGDYVQVYFYNKTRLKDSIKDLDVNALKKNDFESDFQDNEIKTKNIIRTKLNCQRLAKTNSHLWTSFITLTYAENMTNLKQAKLDLNYFIKNIKKSKKDFSYIAIPEFQKRGAIHFHLLTNLSIQDDYIIIKQKGNEKYYNVKYWNKGFTSFEPVKGDIKKIVGYISKYMTKDIDNRLFGIKKYTTSQDLIKPKEEYIDTENEEHLKYFLDLLKDKECIYNNVYKDNFDNDVVFKEFKN